MRSLVAHLSDPELAFLLTTPASVLDWGCAMGDGVKMLSDTFRLANVAGLDFAARALEVARAEYPNFEFIHTLDGSIPRKFDVVITSNCLEHFQDPLQVAQEHLLSCSQLYIVMVPFDEKELLDQHSFRFTSETFPALLSDFVRLVSR